MADQKADILVIGAGMAGLSCARLLAKSGQSVLVLDKGRGPGGRMAARRADVAGKSVSFDHGAQYFTAREQSFQDVVANWHREGAVAPWPAAGKEAWVGTPGMNGPIKAMAAGLDVRWSTRALSMERQSDRWHVNAGEETFAAHTLLVAVPAEQAAELLSGQAPDFAAISASVNSAPCWAVMAAFDKPLAIKDDTMRSDHGAISWAARNSAKPQRAGTECWVLHASPARSAEIIDCTKEEVAALLLSDFFAQAGISACETVHLTAHRWLYAMPSSLKGEPAHFDSFINLGIASDYLHSPRVEGAFLSGQALAHKVMNTIINS